MPPVPSKSQESDWNRYGMLADQGLHSKMPEVFPQTPASFFASPTQVIGFSCAKIPITLLFAIVVFSSTRPVPVAT